MVSWLELIYTSSILGKEIKLVRDLYVFLICISREIKG